MNWADEMDEDALFVADLAAHWLVGPPALKTRVAIKAYLWGLDWHTTHDHSPSLNDVRAWLREEGL